MSPVRLIVSEAAEPMVPGDANADGLVDLSDSIMTLRLLFLGDPARFPCGDGTSVDSANIRLLDWQPDGRIDISDAIASLSFLFLAGPAHTLAVPGLETRGCVPMAGCPGVGDCS